MFSNFITKHYICICQLDEICTKNKKLETQAISVQHRLTNLQRKQDVSDRQRAADKFTDQLRAQAQGNKIAKSGKQGFNQHSKVHWNSFQTWQRILDYSKSILWHSCLYSWICTHTPGHLEFIGTSANLLLYSYSYGGEFLLVIILMLQV